MVFALTAAPAVQAQSCPNIPSGGGESLSASISISATGQPVSDQGLVPAGTVVRIDAVATAFGDCTGMACCCVPTGAVYNRTVGQIYMTADISTTTGLNGFYTIGSVQGRKRAFYPNDKNPRTGEGYGIYRDRVPSGCPGGGWGPVGALGDFWGNYNDMRSANTKGADKYFHCRQIVKLPEEGQEHVLLLALLVNSERSLTNTSMVIQRATANKIGRLITPDALAEVDANHAHRFALHTDPRD